MFYGLGILPMAFWIWMLVDCIQNEPERNTWLWIVFFFNLPAAAIYFFFRFLPRMNIRLIAPGFLGRWTRRREILAAEAAARNIGNAHQFVKLGEIYQQVGMTAQTGDAFQRALEKDPEDREALWQSASADLDAGLWPRGRDKLRQLLALEPAFKFGDASLAYGRALVATGDEDKAREHLEAHLQQWGHPTANVVLARLLARAGDRDRARVQAQLAVDKIHGSPDYYYRNHRPVLRQARKLLRELS